MLVKKLIGYIYTVYNSLHLKNDVFAGRKIFRLAFCFCYPPLVDDPKVNNIVSAVGCLSAGGKMTWPNCGCHDSADAATQLTAPQVLRKRPATNC